MVAMDGAAGWRCVARTRCVAAIAGLLPAVALAQAGTPSVAETAATGVHDAVMALAHPAAAGEFRPEPLEARRDPVLDRETLVSLGAARLGGRAETASVGYRWWSAHGPLALGVGVSAVTQSVLAPALGHEPERLVAQTGGPALTVGWRVRLTEHSQLYADTSAVHGLAADGGTAPATTVTTFGGVEWQTSKSRLGFDRGSVAMKLDSGYRLSLRTRRGGVLLMLRGSF